MMRKQFIKTIASAVLLLSTSACTMLDTKVDVVDDFQLTNYLGTWHEIARLDHSFERGMNQVTANYSVEGDKVIVINKGYLTDAQKWKEAEGKAYFIESEKIARLKVSFFGPFYGAYQIHDLVKDDNGDYQASLVIGPNNEYAWILARDTVISDDVKQRFVSKMRTLGINEQDLIWVSQN
ncbi:lipocalin family protein [Shewanella sp. MMG014]|nr:lipocalin family protein [Shewanella sp. MMG014]